MNWGIEVLQTSALPLGYGALWRTEKPFSFGAEDEARTRYLHLGKVALYQMSYSRKISLPRREMVPPIGVEPMTRGFSVPCSTN